MRERGADLIVRQFLDLFASVADRDELLAWQMVCLDGIPQKDLAGLFQCHPSTISRYRKRVEKKVKEAFAKNDQLRSLVDAMKTAPRTIVRSIAQRVVEELRRENERSRALVHPDEPDECRGNGFGPPAETKELMNSRQDEDDRVQRLLSLLDLAKEPESSDHVDDDTLALLTGGRASAEELAAVRTHLVVCPPCRRLVGQILGDAERSQPEVRPARTWGWLRRPPAILAWAVAACLLLGVTVVIWSSNRGGGAPRPGPQPGPGNAPLRAELLAATVSLGAQRPPRHRAGTVPDHPQDRLAARRHRGGPDGGERPLGAPPRRAPHEEGSGQRLWADRVAAGPGRLHRGLERPPGAWRAVPDDPRIAAERASGYRGAL